MRQGKVPLDTPQSPQRAKLWEAPIKDSGFGAPYYFVLCALLVEFGRPQDILPFMKAIPFASILDGLIALALISSGKVSFAARQTKLWVGLLILMAVHVPLATNNFWAAITLKDMLQNFCLYLGIITFVNSPEKLVRLIKAWLGVHVLLAVNGIAHKGEGIGGWMGDENDFCMVMNMIVPFAFFAMVFAEEGRKKVIYLVLLAVFVITVMVTLSRGGFIGLAAVGAYVWYKSPKKLQAVLIALVMAFVMVIFAPDKYWDEIGSTTSEDTMTTGTGAERLYSWGIGWRMFIYNPVLGVGQGNFPWNVDEYQGEDRFNERSLAGRAAHSMPFTLLAELGIVGTIIFASMLITTFKGLRSSESLGQIVSMDSQKGWGPDLRAVGLARAMAASIIAYLVSSIFISTLYYPSVWVMIGFSVALASVLHHFASDESQKEPNIPRNANIPWSGAGRRRASKQLG